MKTLFLAGVLALSASPLAYAQTTTAPGDTTQTEMPTETADPTSQPAMAEPAAGPADAAMSPTQDPAMAQSPTTQDPAMAQSPTTQDPAMAQSPTPPMTDMMTGTPATGTAATDPAASDPAMGTATGEASASTAMAMPASDVLARFSEFDKDGDGQLSPLEFAYLSSAMKDASGAAAKMDEAEKAKTSKRADNPAVDMINASAIELAQVDQNGDFKVSQDELAGWGQGGPQQ